MLRPVVPPDPTARFRHVVGQEPVALDEAALLIAAHDRPDLDVEVELVRLDDLAAGCPTADLDGLRTHLFVTLGFRGNDTDYYDPRNSFLDHVLTRRTGIPITLSVLAIEVGRRLGVPLVGVGMPGHFLVQADDGSDRFLDPFDAGAVLDRDGCRELFHRVNGPAAWSEHFLDAVSHRALLARMLGNLRAISARSSDRVALRWVYELRSALPGMTVEERRQHAAVLGATGSFDRAAAVLDALAAEVDGTSDDRLAAARYRARLN